jgi:hypothetical protein
MNNPEEKTGEKYHYTKIHANENMYSTINMHRYGISKHLSDM